MPEKGPEVYSTENSRIWLDPAGYVRFEARPGDVDEVEAQAMADSFIAAAGGIPRYVLADVTRLRGNVSREARLVLAGGDFAKLQLGMAVIFGRSTAARISTQLFIGLARPPFPIRLVRDEQEALGWIRSHGFVG